MPSVAIPSSACDGTEGRAGTSEPHGPGPRYAVAQAASLGTPCPVPDRTIASFPAPSANSSGAAAMCSHRPTEAPSRLATYAPVTKPPTTASPSSSPPTVGSRSWAGVAP